MPYQDQYQNDFAFDEQEQGRNNHFVNQSNVSAHHSMNAKQAEDEWYDQGFDLSEDNSSHSQTALNDDYSINPNLIRSAQDQLNSAQNNIIQADATTSLHQVTKDEVKNTLESKHKHNKVLVSSPKVDSSNFNASRALYAQNATKQNPHAKNEAIVIEGSPHKSSLHAQYAGGFMGFNPDYNKKANPNPAGFMGFNPDYNKKANPNPAGFMGFNPDYNKKANPNPAEFQGLNPDYKKKMQQNPAGFMGFNPDYNKKANPNPAEFQGLNPDYKKKIQQNPAGFMGFNPDYNKKANPNPAEFQGLNPDYKKKVQQNPAGFMGFNPDFQKNSEQNNSENVYADRYLYERNANLQQNAQESPSSLEYDENGEYGLAASSEANNSLSFQDNQFLKKLQIEQSQANANIKQAQQHAQLQDAKVRLEQNRQAYLANKQAGELEGTSMTSQDAPNQQMVNVSEGEKRTTNSGYKLKTIKPLKEKSNSEKSLEELAREYPDLDPEDLVKLKRSSNRCHLVSRTTIYDVNFNVMMYDLKFTAGKVFQVNALKREHVYHVLFGYFIRRGLSCFIGRGKSALVMMPLTYDLLNFIDRYSANRVIVRICPEQPVSPSALHLITKLRRSGMSFAIELMLLLKKDWNKAILSIEYVMIDLSTKVQEQLNVFQRLKIKAPWLKTIGYNDATGEGVIYLVRRQIDFYDGNYWSPEIKFSQDIDAFEQDQVEGLALIHQLFADNPDYSLFLHFLRNHEHLTRDVAVFLYRFRHASPRQVQNVQDLYHYLLDSSASRSFSVIVGRTLMLNYVQMANISSQYVLHEYYVQALVRGYFAEYMSKVFDDPFVEKFAFQAGMFSMLHVFLLKEEFEVLVDESLFDIIDKIYAESELLADIIECVKALETTNLMRIFQFIQTHHIPPASVLVSYEKAMMRTNELLLILDIISTRK